jgi:hypothetical protein
LTIIIIIITVLILYTIYRTPWTEDQPVYSLFKSEFVISALHTALI